MSDQLPVKEMIARINEEDPTVLKAFVAEYYFFKRDFRKAVDIFAELFSDPELSPVIKQSVRNFLVIGNSELRKKELETLDFGITIDYKGQGVDYIDRASFSEKTIEVAKLLELINYHIKGSKE
jgi:hypothetical protein